MIGEIRRHVTDAAGEIRPLLKPLALYALLFRAVSLTLILPVTGWILRSLAGIQPDFLFSNEEIATFLLSPRGAIGGLAFASVTMATIFLEQAGLMAIASMGRATRPLRAEEALLISLRSAGRVLAMAAAQVLRALPFVLPCLAALAAIYLWLLSAHDINYYLSQKPPEWTLALILAAVVVIALAAALVWLAVRWAFAVPICVLERERGFTALRASEAIVRTSARRVTVVLGGWIVLAAAGTAVAVGALGGLGELIIARLTMAPRLAVVVVGTFVILLAATAIVASFLGAAIYSFLVVGLYRDMAPGSGRLETRDGTVLDVTKLLRLDRTPSWSLWVGAGALLVGSIVASALTVEGMDLLRDVEVSAHRGASANAPENTLAAIEQAIVEGADYAEIDVQETADGVVVLLHDTDLMKVAGDPRKIHEVTLAELQQVDVGSLFSPEFAGETVPTLEQAIETADGRIKLNIELKFTRHADALVQRVVELLEQHGVEDAVLMSLSLEGVLKVRPLAPDYPLGHLVSAAVGDVTRTEVDFLALNQAKVTDSLVRSAHRAGKQVYAWTVNTPEDMLSMVLLGVDNLITDYPGVARELLDERSEWSDIDLMLLKLHHRLGR